MAEEDYQAWSRLCELIWGGAVAQAIHVAVELGIPELVSVEPKTAEQLVASTGAQSWPLETVLRALVSFDVFGVDGEGRYSLTRVGRFLLKSAGGPSASEAGEFFDTMYTPLGGLLHMVRTGEVAFDHVYGLSFYDYLSERPKLAASFYDMMEASAPRRYAELSSVYDFAQASTVVDVGGGEGSLLSQILREHSHVNGILYDLAIVTERAKIRLAASGLSGRCEVMAGDFRESVPPGGSVYIVAQILNNFRDEDARRLLTHCRAAMKDGARLLVLEAIASPERASPWRAAVSVGVMAQRGGRTRTEPQLRSLLAAAGFGVEGIARLPSTETYAIQAKPV